MTRHMTLVAALIGLLTVGLGAQDRPPVRVYIGTVDEVDGFVPVGRGMVLDSVKDIQKVLGNKKWQRVLTVVPTAADADVTVEVTERGFIDGRTGLATADPSSKTLTHGWFLRVTATLRVVGKDVKVPLTGDSTNVVDGIPLWRDAGESVADQIIDWVRANADRLPRR